MGDGIRLGGGEGTVTGAVISGCTITNVGADGSRELKLLATVEEALESLSNCEDRPAFRRICSWAKNAYGVDLRSVGYQE